MGLLREINASQEPEQELRRRWFTCPEADLYTWQDADGRIHGFELCYGKPHGERSLRWGSGAGFRQTGIDDGEARPWKKASPIAVADGIADLAAVALEFERLGAGIDPGVYRFVLTRLHGVR